MSNDSIKYKDQVIAIRYPTLLNNYLEANCKSTTIEYETKEVIDSLLPLIPIVVAIGAGAVTTWLVNKEQMEYIKKEF